MTTPRSQNAAPTATLQEALALASRWVLAEPGRAVAQCRAILEAAPGEPQARFLLGVGLRRSGDPAGAVAVLEPLARAQPNSPQLHHELGVALDAVGQDAAAETALRRAAELKPAWDEPWKALSTLLWRRGDAADADAAHARSLLAAVDDAELRAAAELLREERLASAETALRAYLQQKPDTPAALRMLAEIGTRLGRYRDAEALLARCLELAPAFTPARHNYALVLYRQNRAAEALPHIDLLLAVDPRDHAYRNLKAAALGLVGDHQGSIDLYAQGLAERPNQPKIWLSYGHALKTAGRQADAIGAYRRSLDQALSGEAWWSLANLKTYRFDAADLAAMAAALERDDLAEDDRLHLHYALGKAFEDRKDDAAAFRHYGEGARLRRSQIEYDADDNARFVDRSCALFTPDFFAARAGAGCPDPAPIFVVGLPRSGSTLVEQILASHSQVEGTMELPDLFALARSLEPGAETLGFTAYPDALAALAPDQLRALGEAYIERTRIQRKLGRPFFIDKMPNNFMHIGMIELILPRAKVIDTRRGAMATCFSAFKQHFARGQNFSYDLEELGRYYRDYVRLMERLDRAAPGRTHRVSYEALVADTEGEVRRLLAYCGLNFEQSCLNFHQNDRSVRTASSEQVRRPIFRDGLDQWRRYDGWLDPLRRALGPDLADGGLSRPQ